MENLAQPETIQMNETGEPTHLMWTGGWDSTYRFLQLVITLKKTVQPHYLIFTDRNSLLAEILAMETIKTAVFKNHPEARSLVLPTIYVCHADIPRNPQISAALKELCQTARLGNQYNIFAQYIKWKNLRHLELGVFNLHDHIEGKISQIKTEIDSWHELSADEKETNTRILFDRCRFPLYGLDKLKLEELAREQGFIEQMYQTWFCYEPQRGMQPCGRCYICRNTIADGMGKRISAWRRWQGNLYYQIKRILGMVKDQERLVR